MSEESGGSGESDAPRRGQNTRERILQVSEELIAQHGLERFELKEVAARVGIRSPSIFAHFKGKDAVALEVSRRVGLSVLAHFVVETEGDPLEVLRASVRRLVAHLAGNPAHVRLLLADLARQREIQHIDGAAQQVEPAEARLAALLAWGRERGVFRQVRTDLYMAQMLGAILSLLAWYGWDEEGELQGQADLRSLQADAAEMAVRYLLVPGQVLQEQPDVPPSTPPRPGEVSISDGGED